jgi:hypothetical protein
MKLFGLFQKRIEGDDALLQLAKRRFEAYRLAPEIYVESPEQMASIVSFLPSSEPVVVHLPRWYNPQVPDHRDFFKDILHRSDDRILGFVGHDSRDVERAPEQVLEAFRELQLMMSKMKTEKQFFYEYAVGVSPNAYAEIFEKAKCFENISPCIDVGHVGIRTVRDHFSKHHPSENVCSMRPWDEGLEGRWQDIKASVAEGRVQVLALIERLGCIDKPLHFHLHDGHPLSHLSPYGVSDHLHFEQRIELPFEVDGQCSTGTMFGKEGLEQIVLAIRKHVVTERCTGTLEYHDRDARQPLGEDRDLFVHWKNTCNAEKMAYWCALMGRGAALIEGIR